MDVCKGMLQTSDLHLKTILLDHPEETPVTPALNAAKPVTLLETVLVAIKEGPEPTSSTSMKNMITTKDSKRQTVLTNSNNNSMPCLLTRRQSLPKKWESQRIFPQLD